MTARRQLCAIALCATVTACLRPQSHAAQAIRAPDGMGYPIDARHLSPDSMTMAKLVALAGVAREFADSAKRLPKSIDEVLAFRRASEYISPRPEWAVDGWNRPLLFVLHANREVLLLLSRGVDGEVGGADDLFQFVRLSP